MLIANNFPYFLIIFKIFFLKIFLKYCFLNIFKILFLHFTVYVYLQYKQKVWHHCRCVLSYCKVQMLCETLRLGKKYALCFC